MKLPIPSALKNLGWRIFKSPERKWIGFSTLITDTLGHLYIFFNNKNLKPITVCVGAKNRSNALLTHLVGSLQQCENNDLITLSIFDCNSNDVVNLSDEIKKIWKGKLIFQSEDISFTRSKTFNKAILQSNTPLIFCCDADISVPKNLVKKVNYYCTERSAWFPMVWWLNEKGDQGRFFSEGTGIFASTRNAWNKTKGYDETITNWGHEDWLLYFEFYKHKIACVRTSEPDLKHYWHPSLKPADFTPLF